MRIPEKSILSVLAAGGCIKTFWRRSARQSGTPFPSIPDGMILERAGEHNDTPLSFHDLAAVQASLVCAETWTQIVGGTEFGGTLWRLAPPSSQPIKDTHEQPHR